MILNARSRTRQYSICLLHSLISSTEVDMTRTLYTHKRKRFAMSNVFQYGQNLNALAANKSWNGPSQMGSLLKRHTFPLQLCHPSVHPVARLVILIVLIEWKPEELAVFHTLGVAVHVVGSVRVPEHLRAGGLECVVQLLDRVAEVVSVAH